MPWWMWMIGVLSVLYIVLLFVMSLRASRNINVLWEAVKSGPLIVEPGACEAPTVPGERGKRLRNDRCVILYGRIRSRAGKVYEGIDCTILQSRERVCILFVDEQVTFWSENGDSLSSRRPGTEALHARLVLRTVQRAIIGETL